MRNTKKGLEIKSFPLTFRVKALLTILEFNQNIFDKRVDGNKYQESYEKDEFLDSLNKFLKSETTKFEKLGKKKVKGGKKGKSP